MAEYATIGPLVDGMNASTQPELLRASEYAKGVNTSARGGLIKCRPSLIEQATTGYPAAGTFQGAGVYRLEGLDRLIVAVAGKVYGIRTDTWAVDDYTAIAGHVMSAAAEQFYFCQADKYMIVQDGTSLPLIIDGPLAHAADHDPAVAEVPTGTIMAFVHGRLFVVVSEITPGVDAGQRFFVAGDIMLPSNPSTLLKFTETDYFAGGGALALPNELGFIKGMGFFRNAGGGTGHGPLLVFARNGVSAFAVNAARRTWAQIDLSSVLFTGAGTYSPYSVIPVNDDLFFRGVDGLRSIRYTSSELAAAGGSLSNLPVSAQMTAFLTPDTKDLLGSVSQAYCRNRVYMTARGTGAFAFACLMSLDAAVVSSFGSRAAPIFDGIWTGPEFQFILVATRDDKETAFVFARDGSANKLYYIDDDELQVGDQDGMEPIVWRLETGMINFQDLSKDHKLTHLDVWMKDIRGTFSLEAFCRADGQAPWIPMAQITHSVTVPAGSLPQHQPRWRFKAAEVCNPVTKRHSNLGAGYQVALRGTGRATLARAVAAFESVEAAPGVACTVPAAVDLQYATGLVELNDFEYQYA